MMSRVNGTHTTLRVVTSPVFWLTPGDEFTRGDIAEWLEDGDLPVGLVLEMGRGKWTIAHHADCWVLESQYRPGRQQRLTAGQLRNYNRGKRRFEVLSTLWGLTQRAGEPPTMRELAAELGVVPSLVKYHVDILAGDGLIDKIPLHHRSAHVTSAGAELL